MELNDQEETSTKPTIVVGCCKKSSCPGIVELSTGDYIIVGKLLTADQKAALASVAGVAEDEFAVLFPRELLLEARDLLFQEKAQIAE